MKKEEQSTFGFNLPVEVHRQVKLFCAQHNIKVKEFFAEAIELMISQKEKEEKKDG